MIRDKYYGKKVEILDIDDQKWQGKVLMITPGADSETGENEIAIEHDDGLIIFGESEIAAIKEVK